MLAASTLVLPTWIVPVGSTLLLPACAGDGCEDRPCADLVKSSSSLSTNGKAYQHCIVCSSGSCTTTLKDASGNAFFDCTDSAGGPCTKRVVDAEFAYCNVH